MCKFTGTLAILVPILILTIAGSFGRAEQATIYRCTAKDAVGIQPDGTLDKNDPGAEIKRKEFWRVVIDVRSGRISFPESGILDTRVVQKTTIGHYVLFPSIFRRNKTAANATTDFISLNAGDGQKQPIFWAHSLSYLVSGACELVR
jgi:hypothetical protein